MGKVPKFSWFRHFRLVQWNSAKEDIMMQDNESTISLHKHHPFSVREGSEHVSARYFFAADKTNQKEVMIVHYPTEKMVSGFSTKLLQGNVFVIHRSTM